MESADDKLRQELRDLRVRKKPQHLWSNIQDRLDHEAITRRIRIIENYLERTSNQKGD